MFTFKGKRYRFVPVFADLSENKMTPQGKVFTRVKYTKTTFYLSVGEHWWINILH